MSYSNIRDPDLLGPVIGARVIEITQHDKDDFEETGSRIYLHFDNGYTLAFPIGDDGFDLSDGSTGEPDDPETRDVG